MHCVSEIWDSLTIRFLNSSMLQFITISNLRGYALLISKFKNTRFLKIIGIFLIIICCYACFKEKLYFAAKESIDWSVLVNRLIADGFDENEIRKLFAHPDLKFDQTIMAGKL